MVDIVLRWDGSDLGDIPHDSVTIIDLKSKLYTIHLDDQGPVRCHIKSSQNNSLCCFLDEAKALFVTPDDTNLMMKYSFKPNGSHYGKYKGKKIVIYKEIGEIECSVNDIEMSSTLEIRSAVRRLLLYRELFGIKSTNKSSIVLKKIPNDPLITFRGYKGCYPISIRESSVDLPRNKTVLPDNILNKWFIDGSIDVAILGFFAIDVGKFKADPKSYEKVIEVKRVKFFQQLDSLIGRIDSRLIWLTSMVNSYFRTKIRHLTTPGMDADGFRHLPDFVPPSDFEPTNKKM